MDLFALIPTRWLEREPPSTCHTGLETLFALGAAELGGAAAAGTAAAGTSAALGTAVGLGYGGAAAASALPSLATVGTAASVLGTGLSVKSGLDQAAYGESVAKAQAEQLRQKANEDAAAGQRAAETQLRRRDLVLSRARALGAASGTLATDPTQVDIEGDIAQQGDYNALSALYEGMARARSNEYQAEIDLFRGRRIGAAAGPAAFGQALTGVGGLVDRRMRRNYLLDYYGAAA